MKRAFLVSIGADICMALANDWIEKGWHVAGTFRTWSESLERLQARGATLYECDLLDGKRIDSICAEVLERDVDWEVLVLGSGEQRPVGLFFETQFEDWQDSVTVNLLSQLRFVRHLLNFEKCRSNDPATVIFFAGGGTNNAPQRYSGYIMSKIALIKMTELLDAETPQGKFVIVGPGWVDTKIHQATLEAGSAAGMNYQRTLERLSSDDLTPMTDVIDFCNWIVEAPRSKVGGRNFSVVYDAWREANLGDWLLEDTNRFKLRRFDNKGP